MGVFLSIVFFLFISSPSPPLLVLFVDIQGDREARAAAIAYALWQEPAVDPDSCKVTFSWTSFSLHCCYFSFFLLSIPVVRASDGLLLPSDAELTAALRHRAAAVVGRHDYEVGRNLFTCFSLCGSLTLSLSSLCSSLSIARPQSRAHLPSNSR